MSRPIKWLAYWDNGNGACGTFPYEFDTQEDADAYGREWASESNIRDGIDPEIEEGYSYDIVEKPHALPGE